MAERTGGDLELIIEDLMKMGELTDDLSILRIGYREKVLHAQHECEIFFRKIIKLHIEGLVAGIAGHTVSRFP